jgi:hypothetical protein
LSERLAEQRQTNAEKKAERRRKGSYKDLQQGVLQLVTRQEATELAKQTGFYKRKPRHLFAFEFCLCCAFAAMTECKRGFTTIWRLLASMAGIVVARSAVTQRFGAASAALLESVFFRALARLPQSQPSIERDKLNQFKQVIAQDGTVLQLAPVLKKLFPATRTNVVDAAAKAHIRADVVDGRIIDVAVTGERDSELDEVYVQSSFEANVLHIFDLGYYSHDLWSLIKHSGGFVLMRLKDNANPTVEHVRSGIRRPVASRGLKLKNVEVCKTAQEFDIDARFECSEVKESVRMRVVGLWNPQTQRYHRYVTNLPADAFSVKELYTLYRQRWMIELLMKQLKSHGHLDHLDTSNPDAIRTHIYASLLAAVVLQALLLTTAQARGMPIEQLSHLTVGICAPLMAVPLMMMWLERKISYDELSETIFRMIVHGCRDQNPQRRRKHTAPLN